MVTGKLSDFSGLFIFPLFLYALIGKRKILIYVATGLLFLIWKSPFSSEFINYWNFHIPLQIGRVVDYSDLVALLVLPLSYYFKPKKFVSVQSSTTRYALASFTLFCIIASETTEIRFKNKVRGTNPFSLIGNYELNIHQTDTHYIDTLKINRIRKSTYTIKRNNDDTLYIGEIRKRNGLFFLNQPDAETGYWEIGCFKIIGDSIYNFYPSLIAANFELIEEDFFEEYEEQEKNDVITYFIDNKRKETQFAFSESIEKAKGFYFKEIIDKQDTIELYSYNEEVDITNNDNAKISLKAYPVPFSNELTIEQNHGTNLNIRLINLSGKIVKEQNVIGNKVIWNLSELQAGVYFLELIDSSGETITKKVIKQ